MRLSVLLPTRNGSDYLPGCVDALLRDDADDFEVVVADNANEDGTREILRERARDPRLVVVRSDEVLPVAENWQRAFEAASGRHVLVLGDDDLVRVELLPWLRETLEDDLDGVTFNAYSFVEAGSIHGVETSHYADPHFVFDPAWPASMELSPQLRKDLVRDMFRFRPRVPLNMQTHVFSMRVARRIPAPLFRPPFPDHYALCGMLLRADSWRYEARQPVIIGVSAKSFGHFVYSQEAASGLAYLGINTDFEGRLPGNELVNGMHLWLSLLERDFAFELAGVTISRGDYVARQLWTWWNQRRSGSMGRAEFSRRLRSLSSRDIRALARVAANPSFIRQAVRRVTPRNASDRLWPGLRPLDDVEDIIAFASRLDREVM